MCTPPPPLPPLAGALMHSGLGPMVPKAPQKHSLRTAACPCSSLTVVVVQGGGGEGVA